MIFSLFDCLWTISGLSIFFCWDVPIITRCSTNNCGEKWSCPCLIAVICLLRNCKFCKLSCLISLLNYTKSEEPHCRPWFGCCLIWSTPCLVACTYLSIADEQNRQCISQKNKELQQDRELPMNLCCFSVLIITWIYLTWPRWSFQKRKRVTSWSKLKLLSGKQTLKSPFSFS